MFRGNKFSTTSRYMSDNFAEIVLLASSSLARVDTVVIFTSFSVWTIFISLTFSLSTWDFGITKWTWRALASKAWDALRCANSSRTTRVRITWIRCFNTFLVLTNVSWLAVRISFTFWTTTSDSVWLGNQTLKTSTDGIAKFVWHTSCSWTTRTGITRIRFQDTPENKNSIWLKYSQDRKVRFYFWFWQM